MLVRVCDRCSDQQCEQLEFVGGVKADLCQECQIALSHAPDVYHALWERKTEPFYRWLWKCPPMGDDEMLAMVHMVWNDSDRLAQER